MLHERDEVNDAIRRCSVDVEAGRYRPVEDFNEELGRKYKFGSE